jgi:DNA-binding transcriptional LysR family regulator
MAMLDWNDLHTFACVARAGSLTAAGEALGLHPTTVARRLAAAEAALGAPLFLRSQKAWSLTPRGRLLLGSLSPLVDAVDAVARRAGQGAGVPVRIALTENGARLFAARIAGALSAADVDVELVVGNGVVDLGRGDADFAVRVVAPEDPDLVRRRIGSIRHGVYASSSYRRRAPSFAPGWPGHDVLVPSGVLARGPEATFLGAHAAQARVVLRADSHVALAHAAEAGLGLAVLPTNLAGFHPGLSLWRRLPEIPVRAVWLVMHRSFRGDARLRRAAALVTDAFATLAAEDDADHVDG